jgi:DNA-binding NarL/FixJ family response regulator
LNDEQWYATKTRIHLADDHQILIDGIRTLLNTVTDFEVVGHSLNGSTVFKEVTQNKSDILILDINMPEKMALKWLRNL